MLISISILSIPVYHLSILMRILIRQLLNKLEIREGQDQRYTFKCYLYMLILEMIRMDKVSKSEILEIEEGQGRNLGNLDFPNTCPSSPQTEPIAPSSYFRQGQSFSKLLGLLTLGKFKELWILPQFSFISAVNLRYKPGQGNGSLPCSSGPHPIW